MLAECDLRSADVLGELNSSGRSEFHHNPGQCEKISIFSRFNQKLVRPLHETSRVSVRHLKGAAASDLLLAVVHLRSKLHQTDVATNQTLAVSELARDLARMEQKVGHRRSLLVGDLNMNPFEPGLVAGACLNATMDRRIAAKGERSIDQKTYPFFYNPMWSLLGDYSPGPPGTYYHRGESGQVTYFWHMFDQVLVRPELLPMFDNASLRVIDADGIVSLLTKNGTPDIHVGSDHLPILFRLNC